MRSLGLLSVAHAINHAQAVVLPLIFLKIIDEFGVGVETIAFLAAIGAFLAGVVQLSYAGLTRIVSRRRLLGFGGILFGGGFALTAFATSFVTYAIPNIASRIGGSPQHPVGNGLLAEQFPPERRGFAISAHIAGGNVGTVVVALIGVPLIAAVGWRGAAIVFGLPAIAVGILILLFVRERGTDRAAAVASGTVRSAFGRILRDRDLLWLYLTSALGGGGRGLGVVNLFALIYMTRVLGLDEADVRADVRRAHRVLGPDADRRRLAVGPDRAQAADHRRLPRRRGRVRRVPGRRVRTCCWLWVGIVLMGLFTFAESPQLQALLGDIAPPSTRDASYALYFAMAFGVGSLWTILYGLVIDALGEAQGVPVVFVLMALTFVLAALGTVPIRAEQRARENAAFEATLG